MCHDSRHGGILKQKDEILRWLEFRVLLISVHCQPSNGCKLLQNAFSKGLYCTSLFVLLIHYSPAEVNMRTKEEVVLRATNLFELEQRNI